MSAMGRYLSEKAEIEKLRECDRIEIRGVTGDGVSQIAGLVKDASPARKHRLEGLRRGSLSAVWPRRQALHQSCG